MSKNNSSGNPFNMKRNLFILLFISLGIQGCAGTTDFRVTVDSISDKESFAKRNYILYPGSEGIDIDDLQYREYAQYVYRVLASTGYNKATSLAEADIVIFFSYGIGDPETHKYSYAIPTWGQTGISSSNTYGTLNTLGDTTTYSSSTTHTPSYGITGSTTVTGSYTTYFRHITLNAIDLEEYRNTEKSKQVWKTTVTSSGSSGDLRRVLPVLVAASKDYLGKDTGKKIKLTFAEDDPQIIEIKGVAR